VTLRKPVDTCTKNVIGNTVKFKCEDGVIMEHVYHDILDGSTCDSVPGACTCDNERVISSPTGKTSADPSSSGGLRTYVMPITNGCTEQFFGAMLMTWDDYCQPTNACEFPSGMPFGYINPKTTAVIDGSTPGKFFYETFGVGGVLETQGLLPQGIAGINKTYIDSKTGPLNMVHYAPGLKTSGNAAMRAGMWGANDGSCITPGAPTVKSCGYYHVIEYDGCDFPEMDLVAGGPDVENKYTNDDGIFKGCEDKVKSERYHCFMRTSGSMLDGTPAPPIDCASEPSCKVPAGKAAGAKPKPPPAPLPPAVTTPPAPGATDAPASGSCPYVKDDDCFDSWLYTCESCCTTSLNSQGSSCWDEVWTAERCCTDAKAVAPARCPYEADPTCFDWMYPCEKCCTTDVSITGGTCWDAVFTKSRCCVAGGIAVQVFTPPSGVAPPVFLPPVPVFAPTFLTPTFIGSGVGCVDSNPVCSIWALIGECEKPFGQAPSLCPQSCGACGSRRSRSVALYDDKGQPLTKDSRGRDLPVQFDREGVLVDSRGRPVPMPDDSAQSSSSVGVTVGLAVGGLCLVSLMVAAAVIAFRRRSTKASADAEAPAPRAEACEMEVIAQQL